MRFDLLFTEEATRQYDSLATASPAKHRKVQKTLGLLETNPRHPSLQTHKYISLTGPNQEEVFEAYVENRTPAAFRVFWYYGPQRGEITIISITPHP